MKIYYETDIQSFSPWCGGTYNYKRLEQAGKLDEFQMYIEDLYPEGIDETQLNDILWFEDEFINEILGESEDE